MAHKRPNTAFYPLRGAQMPPSPQDGHKLPHNAKQMALWLWALPGRGLTVIGREKSKKVRRELPSFSQTFASNGIGPGLSL